MDPDITDARVIAIYKKGDPTLQHNYTPISLLNSIYKLYGYIVKGRLEAGIEANLKSTQYGFRKGHSTIQAIHCIRRIKEKAERTGSSLGVILLDWEKAFDKITHKSIQNTGTLPSTRQIPKHHQQSL